MSNLEIAHKLSRRHFLGGAALLGGFSPLALQLAASNATAAGNDYRALVCLYLDGGLDHMHTIIPSDPTNYDALRALRPGIAMPDRAALSSLGTQSPQGGRTAALHPNLPRMKQIYDQGKMAIVYGHGGMEAPASKSQLLSGAVRLPSAAGSHNNGDAQIHTFGDDGTRYGWGGRAMDVLASMNPDNLFSSMAVGPLNNAFSVGSATEVIKADVTGRASNIAGLNGAVFGSAVASAELNALLQRTSMSQAMDQDYLKVNRRVMDSYAQLNQAFAATSDLAPIPTDTSIPNYRIAWRDNDVVAALRTVARCIAARNVLRVNRQVFFVNMRNFDTHSAQAADLDGRNFLRLDAAIGYFYDTLAAMGLSNNVTLFTTSEFGRCAKSNGDGTDHGWGGASFVVGGAVKGGDIYGSLTDIAENSNDLINVGGSPMSIPTISNQQYCSTLASWLGVPDSALPDIFPNLNRFSPAKLNFL
ncbi:DUF1501 domain-containing protein [Aquidulcibacter sp.]|uniref:DUF1501 domain-containing protein n=1 Tax=Aquidulcibacter sp. TaxID=2052990 RepID=UPI0025BBD7E5|nr:DUF1501 domain-containing protein [Aquidulcibacter sp.]MCA3693472.1 DUF1501 domain-containing protein [Aquidulcibacter sp.]